MPIEIKINDSLNPNARYITYAPSPCQVRQTPASSALTVKLTSKAAHAGGGVAVFYANRVVGAQPTATLTVTLPANGTWVDFGLGGKQGKAERRRSRLPPACDRRRRDPDGSADGARPQERQQAQSPRARPVSSGAGKAQQRHRRRPARTRRCATCTWTPPIGEEHGGPHFLPWHRAYLLDLERGLQAIDPSVSMHYWRFDQPAPKVFTKLFMGETKRSPATADFVLLDPGNPLVGWVTDSVPGILRASLFNTKTEAAPGLPGFELLNQAQTLGPRGELPCIPWHGGHAPWGRARLVQRLDL